MSRRGWPDAYGTAKITLFDSHVVGCHAVCQSGQTGCTGPATCTSNQVSFLDTNRTIYGYDMTTGHVASTANPIIGSAATVLLSAGATCPGARAAFSPTFD